MRKKKKEEENYINASVLFPSHLDIQLLLTFRQHGHLIAPSSRCPASGASAAHRYACMRAATAQRPLNRVRVCSSALRADGHNDFAYMVRGWFRGNLGRPDFDIHTMPIGQTDIARLRKGRLGGQFWSAFVPWCVCVLALARASTKLRQM